MNRSRHSWPLSREGSLACHTYCEPTSKYDNYTMTRVIRLQWSSPRTRGTHTYCLAFGSGPVTTCSNDLGRSSLGFGANALTTAPPPRLKWIKDRLNSIGDMFNYLKIGKINYTYLINLFIQILHLFSDMFNLFEDEYN